MVIDKQDLVRLISLYDNNLNEIDSLLSDLIEHVEALSRDIDLPVANRLHMIKGSLDIIGFVELSHFVEDNMAHTVKQEEVFTEVRIFLNIYRTMINEDLIS